MGINHAQSGTTCAETPLARLVREQGRLKGWVADQLGISRSRLSRLLTGERQLTLEEAAAAARAFGVPIETLLKDGERHEG